MTNHLLAELAARLPPTRRALAQAIGDIPASGGSGTSSGISDRTGRLALGLIEGIDAAILDSERLNALERQCIVRLHNDQRIEHLLAQIVDICDRWAPTQRRKSKIDENLRAAADDLLNRHDDSGNCDSCKRVPGAWGAPHRKGLCKTCARHLDRISVLYVTDLELPPRRLVEIVKTRGKVTDRDIHASMDGGTRRA